MMDICDSPYDALTKQIDKYSTPSSKLRDRRSCRLHASVQCRVLEQLWLFGGFLSRIEQLPMDRWAMQSYHGMWICLPWHMTKKCNTQGDFARFYHLPLRTAAAGCTSSAALAPGRALGPMVTGQDLGYPICLWMNIWSWSNRPALWQVCNPKQGNSLQGTSSIIGWRKTSPKNPVPTN